MKKQHLLRLKEPQHKCPSCLSKSVYFPLLTIVKWNRLKWVTVTCHMCRFEWQEPKAS